MKFKTDYYRVSGLGLNEGACFLSQRYDPKRGYRPREGESMLVTVQKEGADVFNVRVPLMTDGWITDVWLSESQTLYLARSDKRVARAPKGMALDLSPDSFKNTELSAPIYGLCGISDKCVLAWGDGKDAKGNDLFPVFIYDGKAWKDAGSPGFKVLSMSGVAPDHVIAVGHDSGVSAWNGKKWTRVNAPGPETYNCVQVVSRTEAYATTTSNCIVEGSAHGWSRIAEFDAPPATFQAVAKWKGELWVGAGAYGLLRRVKKTSKLEVVKPNVHATGLDARKDLVIITPDMLVGTADGKKFTGVAKDVVLQQRGDHKLNDFLKTKR